MKLKNFLNKSKEVIKKVNKRTWVACSAVLIIGIAVLLNVLFVPESADNSNGIVPPALNLSDVSATIQDKEPDNQNASAFVEMTLSRKQARDEAIGVLNTLANSDTATTEAKNNAIAGIEVIANCIENEANIESLIKAKGFEECVAVISENSASVIIKTSDSLAPNQIAQISEIVYEQSGILPTELNIIESE